MVLQQSTHNCCLGYHPVRGHASIGKLEDVAVGEILPCHFSKITKKVTLGRINKECVFPRLGSNTP